MTFVSHFRIECEKGDSLEVSEKDARILQETNDFFRCCFSHNTVESETLSIQRLHWTRATANAVVRLIVSGEAKCNTVRELKNILRAADELLLEIKAHGTTITKEVSDYIDSFPVDELKMTLDTSHAFTSEEWAVLLAYGVLLIPEVGVTLKCVQNDEKHSEQCMQNDIKGFEDFLELYDMLSLMTSVPATRFEMGVQEVFMQRHITLGASILKIQRELTMQSKPLPSKKVFTCESFSLRVTRCSFTIARAATEAIKQNLKIGAYVHNGPSAGYYLGGGQGCYPTFVGKYKQISLALEMLEALEAGFSITSGDRKCSLRVTAPNLGTLEQLVDSTWACRQNPGSLGIDFDGNAYFAVKTLSDMKRMMSFLVGEETEVLRSSNAVFKLVHLPQPKETF